VSVLVLVVTRAENGVVPRRSYPERHSSNLRRKSLRGKKKREVVEKAQRRAVEQAKDYWRYGDRAAG